MAEKIISFAGSKLRPSRTAGSLIIKDGEINITIPAGQGLNLLALFGTKSNARIAYDDKALRDYAGTKWADGYLVGQGESTQQ